ncbi:MAG: hypothetical protein SGILL_007844, partial [Bacillariaceae sp.]
MMDEHDHDLEDGNVQLGKPKTPFKDNDDDGNHGRSYDDSEEDFQEPTAGLMRNGRGSGYAPVRTNRQYNGQHNTQRSSSSSCCWILCRGVLVTAALMAVGLVGFYIGQNQELSDYLKGLSMDGNSSSIGGGASSWFKPPSNNNQYDNMVISNMDTKTYSELLRESQIHNPKNVHTVKYNADAVLAQSNNPFDWDATAATPSVVTPPKINGQESSSSKKPNGYLTHPHVVNNQLVFLSEGDAYVTHIHQKEEGAAMTAMKLTTTVGNVLDPKWHPTLPMVAYTATYSGRRDVYLLDLRTGAASPSPMRLTYWDIGVGGVSGLIGWIENETSNDDATSSYSLLFRAMSNEVSLPDYRLYLLHLDNNSNMNSEQAKKTGDLSEMHAALEIEPVPLAQAMDAARYEKCWYFVRYKQSSHTIRYVGGTAENLWKYCDDEASSGALFSDDDYKGTSKDPQVTDTSCDFEGRTIREYSVDAVTGNVVVRIGADLYIMDQETTQAKLNGGKGVLDRRAMVEDDGEVENPVKNSTTPGEKENSA